jgi:N-acetyltransferase 10
MYTEYALCIRFILSLASCKTCLVIDDELNVLPISSQTLSVVPVKASNASSESEAQSELKELQQSLADTQPVGVIVGCTRTVDQVLFNYLLYCLCCGHHDFLY